MGLHSVSDVDLEELLLIWILNTSLRGSDMGRFAGKPAPRP